jgi:predicted nucleotidyltransferase
MESALKNVLGQNVNLMTNSPLSLAESMFKKSAVENAKAAFSDDAMSKRVGVSLDAFAGENIVQNSDDIQKELTEALSKDLNVNEKNEIQQPKTEEINAPQKENVI